MKKILFGLIGALIIVSIWAHPASDLEISYDKETKILEVDFRHSVSGKQEHFITNITVEVNKQEVISQKTMSQDTEKGGQLVYKMIDLKTGDKVKVVTECNKFGKKSASLTIE